MGWIISLKTILIAEGVWGTEMGNSREKKEPVFPESVCSFYYVIHIIFLCNYIELKCRINKLCRFLLIGDVVGTPRPQIVLVPATSREREERVRWCVIEVLWWKRRYTVNLRPGWGRQVLRIIRVDIVWGYCRNPRQHLAQIQKGTYSL